MSEGYIGLYRCLLDKPIWQRSTPEHKVILITLLLMANHEERQWEWQGKKFTVFPGQFVTSLDSIVKEAGKGITIQNVRSALERFEKLEFLTNASTKTGRLITILKWHTYQVDMLKGNKDANKEPTKNQQRTNKEVTPNNNDKNVIMKDIYITAQHLSMSKIDYDKLVNLYGKNNVDAKIEYAKNYKNLKKYVSLYLTLNNWLKSDSPKDDKPNDGFIYGDSEVI